jgi:hypothetical protein
VCCPAGPTAATRPPAQRSWYSYWHWHSRRRQLRSLSGSCFRACSTCVWYTLSTLVGWVAVQGDSAVTTLRAPSPCTGATLLWWPHVRQGFWCVERGASQKEGRVRGFHAAATRGGVRVGLCDRAQGIKGAAHPCCAPTSAHISASCMASFIFHFCVDRNTQLLSQDWRTGRHACRAPARRALRWWWLLWVGRDGACLSLSAFAAVGLSREGGVCVCCCGSSSLLRGGGPFPLVSTSSCRMRCRGVTRGVVRSVIAVSSTLLSLRAWFPDSVTAASSHVGASASRRVWGRPALARCL